MSSSSSKLCDLLEAISKHPKNTGKNIYFIPNDVEGRGELGSYLGNENNKDVIKKVLEENSKDGDINNSIYASVGSSSTQMFIPRVLDENLCNDLKSKYDTKCDVVDKWTILLVPDNFFRGKGNFVPLIVLQSISEKNPELNILIGNSFSHLAYGYEKRYTQDKISDTLFNLKNNIASGTFYKDDKKKIVLDTIQNIKDFANKVIVAPRIKGKERIENGWNLTLSLPDNTKFVDFGGGKTNQLYDDYITSKIDASGTADKFFEIIANNVAGCTGVIRADIEKMVNSEGCKSISVVGLNVKSDYKNYFDGMSPYALNVVKASTEEKGGKLTRRRRGVKISRKRKVTKKKGHEKR